jgi:hypothetical protein
VPIIKRALLWSVIGSLTAVAIWSALGAILWQLSLPHASVPELLSELLFGFTSSAIWAMLTATIAAPAYVVVFSVWQLLRGRLPPMSDASYTRALLSLALALPAIAALVWSFGHNDGLPFHWDRVKQIAVLALLSCWGGVWIPQHYLRQLKGVLNTGAADSP